MKIINGIRHSLHKRLLFVVASASIFTAIVSTALQHLHTKQLIDGSIDQQMKSTLDVAVNYLDENYTQKIHYDLHLLDEATEINTLLSSNTDERLIHQQSVEKLLLSFAKNRDNFYHSLQLLNTEGATLASIYEMRRERNIEDNAPPVNFKNHINLLFKKLKTLPAGSICFTYPTKVDGTYFFLSGIAKSDPDIGGFGGAIIVSFSLNNYSDYIKKFTAFDFPLVWLYTTDGAKISAPDIETELTLHPKSDIQNDEDGNFILYKSDTGEKNSIQSVVETIVFLPTEAYKKILTDQLLIIGLILLTITSAGLVIGYFVARNIVHPILYLTDHTQKVSSGDLDVEIPNFGNDELGTLGKTFNKMIRHLKLQRIALENLANKDSLTGLPNRRQFEESLEQTINQCRRNKHQAALLYIDLDQFKYTNDTFGHPAGDKLIQDVTSRLLETIRNTDIVARLGGDEFAIIIYPLESHQQAEVVSKKILHELSKPFTIEGYQIFSGASIGISIFPDHGSTPMEIIKNADTAMYRAKKIGRNNHQFYTSELSTEFNENIILGSLIRRAIEKNEFTMVYQPKMDFRTSQIEGAEALLRWSHPKTPKINPGKIFSIAESAGFANKLDTWVIFEVTRQIREWLDQGFNIKPISINISGKMLEQMQLVEILQEALNKYNIKSHYLQIEVTENSLISNFEQSRETIAQLHKMGIRLAIDDFGTGYSSLSYLKNIDADILKIDRKFVIDTMQHDADRAIATAMVQLATSLNMRIVVEGIETIEQASFFMTLGAHSVQGYYYFPPLSAEEFIQLL